jgi:cysteine desulfurase
MSQAARRAVYLDNNATTAVDPEVFDAMVPFFREFYGNPSSMHTFGGQVARPVDVARQQVAALLNASPEEIVFTSCGTESDNMAIRGALAAAPEKRHIITTKVEHPAVLNLCRYYAKRGYSVTELPVDKKGRLNLDQLRAALTPDTAILSVMAANNETGVLFPIDEIGKLAAEKGIPFHTDAVQAAGKLALDTKKFPVDLLSLSGHKLHAPKGIGILYIRRGTRIEPLMIGGHQERNRRGGTENVPYIVGLGKACEKAMSGIFEETVRVKALRDRLQSKLLEIPYTYLNGDPDWRLPNTCNIGFEFIEGEAILLHLSAAGIAASSGSACTSGSLEPSHVLMAMEVPFSYAHGSVRFSLSKFNSDEDVDYVLQVMPGIVDKLRAMSPFYQDKKEAAAK